MKKHEKEMKRYTPAGYRWYDVLGTSFLVPAWYRL